MPDLDLSKFIEDLKAPTGAPGGGAASSVAGALGCALLEMVAGVTLSLPRFTEGRTRLEEIRVASRDLRLRFEALAHEDTQAYLGVEAAMKMPKATPEEKATRREAVQRAFVKATEVPLKVVHTAVSALALVPDLLTYGNPNAITDIAVGVLLLDAARKGASLNAEINLGSIKDEEFVKKSGQKLGDATKEAEPYLARLEEAVKAAGLSLLR